MQAAAAPAEDAAKEKKKKKKKTEEADTVKAASTGSKDDRAGGTDAAASPSGAAGGSATVATPAKVRSFSILSVAIALFRKRSVQKRTSVQLVVSIALWKCILVALQRTSKKL